MSSQPATSTEAPPSSHKEQTPEPEAQVQNQVQPKESSLSSKWTFFESLSPRWLACAPMVDQSELSFRMLCRRHGANVCYTPMLHSALTVKDKNYLRNNFSTCQGDRPLVVQFNGNDPDTLLEACKRVEDKCDAVDINFGCPQGIAKKGQYGSFLLEKPDLVW